MGQTGVEKIAQSHAVGNLSRKPLTAGDYVMLRPRHVMTHDNTSAVLNKFRALGAKCIADPTQPVFTLDHNIQDKSAANLAKYDAIREFAGKHGIVHFPAGYGIGHQIMLEEGFVTPGSLIVASDSHSNTYGAVAALGTPIVRTDAAAIWVTGQTWWQVPDSVEVYLQGNLSAGVAGKDVIQTLCWRFDKDEVLNCCVEFTGPGVAGLSMAARMTIANMSTEWGALAGVFPYDGVTEEYFLQLAEKFVTRGEREPRLTQEMISGIVPETFRADPDAGYLKLIELDLSTVQQLVTGPDEVKTARPAVELEKENIRVDKAYLLSCVNGRLEDFRQAAEVTGKKKIAAHVRMYIAAASAYIQHQAEQLGYWNTLTEAGAIALPPGCGPCIGLGRGTLEAGEVAISATNRNFKGRMGERSARAFLASPATVAASAIAGKIRGSVKHRIGSLSAEIKTVRKSPVPQSAEPVEIVEGMQAEYSGRLLYLPKNNMNTDGIFGKEATYRDDLTSGQMAGYVFRNYDPDFRKTAHKGDIIIGGWNFGCGSSREQAATALIFFGIKLVLAGSFSQTYKRNAFNNGLLCLECPSLLRHLAEKYSGETARTIVAGEIKIDFASSTLYAGTEEFCFTPVSRIPQELVAADGLEALIKAGYNDCQFC